MRGVITDIQRFSLKDGPGIRTTVFLKGCNMACAWCHNPETILPGPQLMRYPARCIGCGACARACKTGALTAIPGAVPEFFPEKCTHCGLCANECFSGALAMSGVCMSVDEVMSEIMQDADYYKNSGGGVTISGGEPAGQPNFTTALLKKLKEAGVSTALETNMLAGWSFYESIIPLLDLVMFDIKIMDSHRHASLTGAANTTILENAKRITEILPVIIRTPLIPGVNDSLNEVSSIARFIKTLNAPNINYYELLLFNPLGESKYNALGLKNKFFGGRPQNSETVEKLAEAARESGVEIRIG